MGGALMILTGVIAYAAIIAVIVIVMRNTRNNCNQDCQQGRDCDCDD